MMENPLSLQFFGNKDNWKLHKQLVENGVNPLEIAKVIWNDDVEKLQEIYSQSNFVNKMIIHLFMKKSHLLTLMFPY